ncbi:helix-turn-helix domain-containing protein [Clostridiales bacterium COT073_COT-073]|nr:helix-turn-helix domain-containing protein [Clostridiales bacterium COT073_COT-073]
MQIGESIKQLRLENNLTQEELADRCELSKGFISQLERDLTSPSLDSLNDILESLGTNLAEFFSEKKEEKVLFSKDDFFQKTDKELGYQVDWIIPNAQKNEMEPILLNLEPNGKFMEFSPTQGQIFGYVLSGNVQLNLGKQVYKVKKGNSFYYQANVYHSLQNTSTRPASLLLVSTPPCF